MRKANYKYKLLLAVIAFAIIVRLVFYIQSRSYNPYFINLISDAKNYDQWALEIIQNKFISKRIFYQAPLYPYFLATIYRILGHHINYIYLIQHFLGILNIILLYLVAYRCFNKAVARISCILMLMHNSFIFFEGKLLTTTLFITLNLLIIYFLLKSKEKPSLKNWIISGLLLGISCLSRQNNLILIPFVIIWILFSFNNNVRKRILYVLIIIITSMLIISPAIIQNYVIQKDFTLIAHGGGLAFYSGNNKDAYGIPSRIEGISTEIEKIPQEELNLIEEETGRKVKHSESSRIWFRKAFSFIINNPFAYIKLLFKKFLIFTNSKGVNHIYSPYVEKKFVPVLKFLFVDFRMIFSLSIIGIFLSLKDSKKEHLLYYPYLIANLSVLLLFYVLTRLRLPMVPVLIIFASYGLYNLMQLYKRHDLGRMLKYVIVMIFAFIISSTDFVMSEKRNVGEHINLGFVFLEKGLAGQAKSEFQKEIQINPNIPEAYIGLARCYEYNDKGERYGAGYNYNRCLYYYNKAISLDPGSMDAYNNLGIIYNSIREYDKAEEVFKKALAIDPDHLSIHHNLGQNYYLTMQYDKALNEFMKAVPDLPNGYCYIASIYEKRDNKEKALYYWQKRIAHKEQKDKYYQMALHHIKMIKDLLKNK